MAGVGFASAAADLAGGVIGSAMINQHNADMQHRQLLWEKEKFNREIELANSAHQREVADLRAAGLNPVLSATGGQGAETPQGGSIGALQDTSGQVLSNAVNSAMAQLATDKEIEGKINQMEHQNDLYDAEKLKALAETDLVNEKALETTANAALLKSQKDLVDEQWNKATHETTLAYYKVQQAYEELQYAKKNAKNQADILAAEKRLKIAEANMKEKEDSLWHFSYIWDKGMDIGKVVGQVYGLAKLSNLPGKLGYNSGKAVAGSKSVFGWDEKNMKFY